MKNASIESSSLQAKAAIAKASEEARRLNAIKGEEFLKRTLTPAKRPRDMRFCMLIKQQVLAMIPGLEVGVSYELSEICGTEFWKELGRGEVLKAGLYMSYMVCEEMLPLTDGRYHGATKTYKLKHHG